MSITFGKGMGAIIAELEEENKRLTKLVSGLGVDKTAANSARDENQRLSKTLTALGIDPAKATAEGVVSELEALVNARAVVIAGAKPIIAPAAMAKPGAGTSARAAVVSASAAPVKATPRRMANVRPDQAAPFVRRPAADAASLAAAISVERDAEHRMSLVLEYQNSFRFGDGLLSALDINELAAIQSRERDEDQRRVIFDEMNRRPGGIAGAARQLAQRG